MAESTVIFSIITDSSGKMRTDFDAAHKRKIEKIDKKIEFDELSLISTLKSEPLGAGVRRRVVSISSQSITSASSCPFDGDSEDLMRTSTPLPSVADDSLSDVSFSSCLSSLSIKTDSSQETITSAVISNAKNKKRLSYEQVNQERFGSPSNEGNWRTAPRRISENRTSQPNPVPSTQSSTTTRRTSTISSTSSTSRIPSLTSRPTISTKQSPRNVATKPLAPVQSPPPRPLPAKRVNASVGSYASAASHSRPLMQSPAASFAPVVRPTQTEQTIKLTITTDCDGKMSLNFSNSNSSQSWSINGIIGDSEEIEVCKMLDGNNN